jgi:hypothetical protein
MHHSIHIANGETQGLAGPYEASPLRPAGVTREPVIQIRAYRRPIGSEEASSPDDDVPVSIGELAVRLVARWSLPRIVCRSAAREEDAPTGTEEITGG